MKITPTIFRWLALLLTFPSFLNVQAKLRVVDWFPEPAGLRVINQSVVFGVIADNTNVDLTQIFTVNFSGAVSAIGVALGSAGGTPSLRTSLYRVSNGVVQSSAFATSIRSGEYFADIGPQTVPVWVYAEFPSLALLAVGEQIAVRIQSPRAELWGPRSDVLPGAELVEIPGTDLAFRVYTPFLSIINVGTNLVLRWPSSVTNGAVEVTSSLRTPISWTPIYSTVSTTNQYWMPAESKARFFRLRIP